jgi:hypothetical protein
MVRSRHTRTRTSSQVSEGFAWVRDYNFRWFMSPIRVPDQITTLCMCMLSFTVLSWIAINDT